MAAQQTLDTTDNTHSRALTGEELKAAFELLRDTSDRATVRQEPKPSSTKGNRAVKNDGATGDETARPDNSQSHKLTRWLAAASTVMRSRRSRRLTPRSSPSARSCPLARAPERVARARTRPKFLI
jgi:hypothetical protein